jgi:hypothetical protein
MQSDRDARPTGLIAVLFVQNIARGMVRARRKYAFNPPKIRFLLSLFPHVSFTVSYSNQNNNPLIRCPDALHRQLG